MQSPWAVPSSLDGRGGRGLRCRAASSPSSTRAWRARDTVISVTPTGLRRAGVGPGRPLRSLVAEEPDPGPAPGPGLGTAGRGQLPQVGPFLRGQFNDVSLVGHGGLDGCRAKTQHGADRRRPPCDLPCYTPQFHQVAPLVLQRRDVDETRSDPVPSVRRNPPMRATGLQGRSGCVAKGACSIPQSRWQGRRCAPSPRSRARGDAVLEAAALGNRVGLTVAQHRRGLVTSRHGVSVVVCRAKQRSRALLIPQIRGEEFQGQDWAPTRNRIHSVAAMPSRRRSSICSM